ncbi:hypothetical protein [Leisingera daeponensis]|uniref:hypothetical protein n=1 Tax=Leisingera daeponensis TaxID=405746 RepID=UPI001C94332D|nr:hypothetical protein [Leisingera daeponensis]MBY6059423.1 hypothetical protein [Leisingera daeponensis]
MAQAPNPKGKVALCISGQMRSYNAVIDRLKKYIIEPLNPDIFIHTWIEKGEVTQSYRHAPRNMQRLANRSAFFKRLVTHFADAYDARKSDDEASPHINPERLQKLYRPRKMVVEPFPKDGLWHLLGQSVPETLIHRIAELDAKDGGQGVKNRAVLGGLPMFYKIHACDMLRRAAETEDQRPYDLVIRIRPDLEFCAPIPDLSPKDGVLGTSVTKPQAADYQNRRIVSDQYLWGSSIDMAAYADIWLTLEDLYTEAAQDETWTGFFGGEVMSARHLKHIGLNNDIHRLHAAIARPKADRKIYWPAWKAALKQQFGFPPKSLGRPS